MQQSLCEHVRPERIQHCLWNLVRRYYDELGQDERNTAFDHELVWQLTDMLAAQTRRQVDAACTLFHPCQQLRHPSFVEGLCYRIEVSPYSVVRSVRSCIWHYVTKMPLQYCWNCDTLTDHGVLCDDCFASQWSQTVYDDDLIIVWSCATTEEPDGDSPPIELAAPYRVNALSLPEGMAQWYPSVFQAIWGWRYMQNVLIAALVPRWRLYLDGQGRCLTWGTVLPIATYLYEDVSLTRPYIKRWGNAPHTYANNVQQFEHEMARQAVADSSVFTEDLLALRSENGLDGPLPCIGNYAPL